MSEEMFEGGDSSVAVDLSGVEEATFEALPVGIYEGVIAGAEYKLSQSSGAPMWSLQLQVIGGDYDNRRVFDNVSFSAKALPFTKKTLRILAPELLSGPFDPEEAVLEMQGREVRFQTKLETYQGEKQTRVKAYLPVAGSAGGDDFMGG